MSILEKMVTLQKEKPKFELRFRLTEAFAKALRTNPLHDDLRLLQFIVWKHGLALQNILEEFRDFAANPENQKSTDKAVRALYVRTKASLANPESILRFGRAYKIVSDGNATLTETPEVLEIEAELKDLAKKFPGLIEKVSRAEFPANGAKIHGLFGPDTHRLSHSA